MTGGFVHYCASPGCGRWGSFGFGVRLRVTGPDGSAAAPRGRWYCAAHRAQGEAWMAAGQPTFAAAAPAAAADQRQGVLL